MKKYVLADQIILRKEYFGCLVLSLITYLHHQFNLDGAIILEKVRKPMSIKELVANLSKDGLVITRDNLNGFIQQCLEDKILEISDSDRTSNALVYFWEKNDASFMPQYLFRPTNVSIYLTHKCNKRCLHCVTRATSRGINKELGPDNWIRALKKLRKEGVLAIVFTGGEPFLKDGIKDILSCADDLKFKTTLLTDYDGLSLEHLDFLKSLRFLRGIQVSLDGGCPETHDFLRGKGSFDLAMRRLALLKESGIKYAISTTVHKKNISEIDEIVTIYQKYKAFALWLNPLAPFGRGRNLSRYVLANDELRRLSKKYLDLVRSEKINPGNDYWRIVGEQDETCSPLENTPESISLGVFNLSIDSNGECYLDSKMMSEHILPLGNILKMSLGRIWNRPFLDKVRAHYDVDRGDFCFKPLSEIEDLQKRFSQ